MALQLALMRITLAFSNLDNYELMQGQRSDNNWEGYTTAHTLPSWRLINL